MIVTEFGAGTACGATRRWSWGVEFAAASRGTRRSSVRGPVLSTAPSGRRYASSAAGTCRRFPCRAEERSIKTGLCWLIFVTSRGRVENTNLILKSGGLLLEPRGFEVVDDVGDPPVGGVWQLAVLHRAAQSQGMHPSQRTRRLNTNVSHWRDTIPFGVNGAIRLVFHASCKRKIFFSFF